MTDEGNETPLDDPMYVEKSKREEAGCPPLYDVVHYVGTEAYTVLDGVREGTARMYVKGSGFDCEIVPHVVRVGLSMEEER